MNISIWFQHIFKAILYKPLSLKSGIMALALILSPILATGAKMGWKEFLEVILVILNDVPTIAAVTIVGTLLALWAMLPKSSKEQSNSGESGGNVSEVETKPEETLDRPTKIQDTSSNPSFVQNYTHDIFVSYAELDENWCIPFVYALQERLAKRLGGMDKFSLYMGEASFLHSDNVVPETANRIQDSAILLRIVSPKCSDSKRYDKELDNFLTDNKRAESVFTVAVSSSSAQPYTKIRRQPVNFYVQEKSTAQWRTLLYGENKYYEQVETLLNRLIERMESLKGSTPKLSKSVFLARVAEQPDYLNQNRDKFKIWFKQQGYCVLPEETDNSLDEQHLRQEIAKCEIFVQLLTNQSDFPLQSLQANCAKKVYGEKAVERILQWRHHNIKVENLSGDYKNLLDSETVVAASLRNFQKEVENKLKISITSKQKKKLRVLVNFGPEKDKPLADRLMGILEKRPSVSPELSSPRLAKNTKKMKHCNAMVVICGNSETEWVRGQLADFEKYSPKPQRTDCFRSAICRVTHLVCPTDLGPLQVRSFSCADNTVENDVSNFLSYVESCV